MEDAGTLPTSLPARRWSLGAESPVSASPGELPPSLLEPLKQCADSATDVLPGDYGDVDGLWVTVRRQNPFEVLLLDPRSQQSPDDVLGRFRALSKFWTQKLTISRQGATRTAIRQKYGDELESYVDNVQWAYDQLGSEDGMAFWRRRLEEERGRTLWSRIADSVDATLSDGLLEGSEVAFLLSRAQSVGYDREEFAAALRDTLNAHRFEPEIAPFGDTEAVRLASVRWATAEVWKRLRTTSQLPAVLEEYYVRVRRTGAVLGPLPAARVRDLVRSNEVGAGDDICVVGAAGWQSISQSAFAHVLPAQVAVSGRRCPNCGTGMTAIVPSMAAAWVTIIIGICTAIFFVGVVLVIIGIVMLVSQDKTVRWKCTRCGHSI